MSEIIIRFFVIIYIFIHIIYYLFSLNFLSYSIILAVNERVW